LLTSPFKIGVFIVSSSTIDMAARNSHLILARIQHKKLEDYRVSESKAIILKHVSELKLSPSP
jgi:hypothetical protein